MPGSPSDAVLFAACANPVGSPRPELTLPGLVVVANGIMIDQNPETYEAAQAQLHQDECLVAMVNRGRQQGPVGVLVENDDDFDSVSREGFEAMFIIERELAEQAR